MILIRNLEKSGEGETYLKSRGLSKKTIEDYLIGFTHLEGEQCQLFSELSDRFDVIDLINSRIAVPYKNGMIVDYFGKGRVIFPIYEKGEVTGLVGRSIFPNAKLRYKTLQFQEKLIFNIDSLLYDPKEIYLTDGVIDALSMHEAGFVALGILGIQNFGIETANKLRYYNGKIICLFDTDKNGAGNKGRNSVLSTLYEVGLRKLHFKELPENEFSKTDINNLFLEMGKEEFSNFIENLELQEFSYVPRNENYPRGSRNRINIPILAIVQPYVELKQEGEYRFRGKCPFHADSDPSFIVSADKNTYHCFGCGEHGTSFDFYKKIHGIQDNGEALKRISQENI